MRDMQVLVSNCNYGPPVIQLSNISGGYFTSALQDTIISGAAYLSFDITSHGVPISDSVILYNSNAGMAAPGSLLTIDNAHGNFFWIPAISDTGFHILSFSAEDTNCTANNAIVTNTRYVIVKILPNLYDSLNCYSGAIGGNLDSSDIGRFIIGTDTFGSVYSHLANPTAINSHVSQPDTIQLYVDSTYNIQEAGIMNTIHDADAKVTLFVDFNNNHHFDIPGERIWTSYQRAFYYYIVDTAITIPNTVVTDSPLAMRLILNNNTGVSTASDGACGPYMSGETEDFIVIFRNAPTSIKNHANIKNIRFWPNPTSGKFAMTLDCNNPIKQLRLSINAVTGQNIFSRYYHDVDSSGIVYSDEQG